MGRLVELEVQDFKSYRGKQTIGPFHNFTSVIGPNGSGKSNLMDAISFVLGVKSSHLRSTQLKELIYRGRNTSDEGEPEDMEPESASPKRTHVSAIYETSDKTIIRFTRTVTEAGTSDYRINDKVVTYSRYSAALEKENILIKAKNFLVFQGDVEAVASQSPKELTRLIEQISGSLELKAEYERLKGLQDQATENSAHTFNKKRGINAEMKQFKEQKEEAERFAALQKKRTKETQLYLLWKLYHLDQKIMHIEKEIAEEEGESKERTSQAKGLEARLKAAKKQHAAATKELLRGEARVSQKQKDIEERKPQLLQVEEKIRHWRQKYDKARDNATRVRTEHEREEQSIKSLQEDHRRITVALRKHDEAIQQRGADRGAELGQAALLEYNQKKEEVRRQTAVEKQQLTTLRREKKADEDAISRLEEGNTAFEARKSLIEQECEVLGERKNRLEGQVQELRAEIETARSNIKAADREKQAIVQKETALNETLMATQQQLQQARVDRSDNEKEVKRREMLQELKRVFEGGVHGRMLDLCKPTQRKYQLAISIILGRNMDAIVVDTEKIAIDCIQYLREQRKGMATFLPLDTIQTRSINERYRSLKGAHLALDVIQFDDAHARAMNYACGSALVCDTMDIARDICYNQRIEVKAVALDGTVIHKTGMITGGQSQGDNRNAQRWDDKDLENLRKNQTVLSQELQDLQKQRRKVANDEHLRIILADLESKLRATEEDLTMTIRKLAALEEEVSHIGRKIQSGSPEMKKLREHLAEIEERIEEADAKVREVENEVFDSFCQSIGVAHIREYEEGQMRVSQESADKRMQLETAQAKLANQLEFENGKLAATTERLRKLEDAIASDKASLERYTADRTALEEACQAIQAEVDTMTTAMTATKATVLEKAAAVAEVKKEIQNLNKEAEGRSKSLAAKTLQIDKYCAEKFSIFRRCKLEEIELPLVHGSLADISLEQLENGQRANPDPDAMDVDEEESTQNSRTQVQGIQVKFTSLKSVHTSDGSDEVEIEFQERLANLTSEIDRIAPNMRAIDKLDEVENKLRDTAKEFDSARKEAKSAKDAFNKLKQERFARFSAAYTHIAEHIDPIYKELTKSKTFPLGGTAYLSLEDSEEPYNDGIKYHAMPPMKRFRDMELLSGGEKTVAALALLFAIHSYHPAPFFVLDEVDAALDNANVAKVANYIRRHASDSFQFIVISLKNTFYEKAEALVGIWKDKGMGSSRVLTLALDEFMDA